MTTIPEQFPQDLTDRRRLFSDLIEPLAIGPVNRRRRLGFQSGDPEQHTKRLPDTDGTEIVIEFDGETDEPSGGEGEVYIRDSDGTRRHTEDFYTPVELNDVLRRVYEGETGVTN